jgi:hypothetical protein
VFAPETREHDEDRGCSSALKNRPEKSTLENVPAKNQPATEPPQFQLPGTTRASDQTRRFFGGRQPL